MLRVFRYFIFTKNPFKNILSLSLARSRTHTDSLTPLFALAIKDTAAVVCEINNARSIEVNDAKDAL